MNAFAAMAAQNWSAAVAEATRQYTLMRELVIAAARSPDPSVRSASIAVFNEADDLNMHDLVLSLLDDSSQEVQEEALEYLCEHAQGHACGRLLFALQQGAQPFLVTEALRRSSGRNGPILDEDSTLAERAYAVEEWRTLVVSFGSDSASDA